MEELQPYMKAYLIPDGWLSFLQDPLCLGVWPGLWRAIAHSDGTSEGALLLFSPACEEGLLVGKRMPGVPLKV